MSNSPDNELDFTRNNSEDQVLAHTVDTETPRSNTNEMKSIHPCNLCHKKFAYPSNVIRHIRKRHPEHYSKKERKAKIYECEICRNSFASLKCLWAHLKKQHNVNRIPKVPRNAKKFKCEICNSWYFSRFTLKRHIKTIHQIEIPPVVVGNLICSECQSSLQTKASYFNHIITVHGIHVNEEILQFENEEDFASWKSDIEEKTVSSFRTEKFSTKNDLLHATYICHRSGSFVSKGTGKRRLKTGGSNKINCFCPASICLKAISVGAPFPAEVKYISSHLGHSCEIERLRIKQRQRCQQVTKEIVCGFVNKLEEFSSEDQCTEIDRAIAMLTEMKNKKKREQCT